VVLWCFFSIAFAVLHDYAEPYEARAHYCVQYAFSVLSNVMFVIGMFLFLAVAAIVLRKAEDGVYLKQELKISAGPWLVWAVIGTALEFSVAGYDALITQVNELLMLPAVLSTFGVHTVWIYYLARKADLKEVLSLDCKEFGEDPPTVIATILSNPTLRYAMCEQNRF